MQDVNIYDTIEEAIDEICDQEPVQYWIEPLATTGTLPVCCLTGIFNRVERYLLYWVWLTFHDSAEGAGQLERFQQWEHGSGFEEQTSEKGVSYSLTIGKDLDKALAVMNRALRDICGWDESTPCQYRLTTSWCPYCDGGESCNHLVFGYSRCNCDLYGNSLVVDGGSDLLTPVCLEWMKKLDGLDGAAREKAISAIKPARLHWLLEMAREDYEPDYSDCFSLGFNALVDYFDSLFFEIEAIEQFESASEGGPGCSDSFVNYWADDAPKAAEAAMTLVKDDAATLDRLLKAMV